MQSPDEKCQGVIGSSCLGGCGLRHIVARCMYLVTFDRAGPSAPTNNEYRLLLHYLIFFESLGAGECGSIEE